MSDKSEQAVRTCDDCKHRAAHGGCLRLAVVRGALRRIGAPDLACGIATRCEHYAK